MTSLKYSMDHCKELDMSTLTQLHTTFTFSSCIDGESGTEANTTRLCRPCHTLSGASLLWPSLTVVLLPIIVLLFVAFYLLYF